MHNSLLHRERLRQVNNDPLCRERRDPHRSLHLDRGAAPATGEMRLTGSWAVVPDSQLVGIPEVVADLRDLLARFEVPLDASSPQMIVLSTGGDIADGGFRLRLREGAIEIRAGDTGGLWAGLVYLEREMALRHAPIVPLGVVERQPSWQVQIGQLPYGTNSLVPHLSAEYLSDDAFRMLAHFGLNGTIVYGDWLCYVDSQRFPELNSPDYAQNIAVFRDAAERATRYGVQLYYVPVSPKLAPEHPLFERVPTARGAQLAPGPLSTGRRVHNLCSSDPQSLAFHGEVMGNLFREVPELGGVILIIGGESYYHCFMRPDQTHLPPDVGTNCQRCAQRRPEEVVNGLLQATAEGVYRRQPDAWVLAWPYSAFRWSSDPAQLELVRTLPLGVGLLTTIDKDEWVQKDGYKKLIWDYSVDYAGPADHILRQAEILRERDVPLFVKTETALGLESPQYPYVPCLQRHAERWINVRALQPAGVFQSWMFFGMWGSRAEELGWWTSWHPDVPMDEVLWKIARRDFGRQAAQVIQAWERMTEAVSHIPYIPSYYTGPEYLGPAHPLLFSRDEEIPDVFKAPLFWLQETEETFSTRASEVRRSLVMNELPGSHVKRVMQVEDGRDVWDVVLAEYQKAVLASEQALQALRAARLSHGPAEHRMLAEETLLVELIYRTFLTTLHTIRFLRSRDALQQSAEDQHWQVMTETATRELENARSARHIFVEAPWLDLARNVEGEYPSSLAMIDTKIALLERALQMHVNDRRPATG